MSRSRDIMSWPIMLGIMKDMMTFKKISKVKNFFSLIVIYIENHETNLKLFSQLPWFDLEKSILIFEKTWKSIFRPLALGLEGVLLVRIDRAWRDLPDGLVTWPRFWVIDGQNLQGHLTFKIFLEISNFFFFYRNLRKKSWKTPYWSFLNSHDLTLKNRFKILKFFKKISNRFCEKSTRCPCLFFYCYR